MEQDRQISGGFICYFRPGTLYLLMFAVMGSETWAQVTAGVTLSATMLNLNEGGSGNYTVNLNTQPTGNVTMSMASDNTGAVTTTPGSLTFTTINWSMPQTVTVMAGSDVATLDDVADVITVTITHTVSGYGTVTAADVMVRLTDSDAGICSRTPRVHQQISFEVFASTGNLLACRNITLSHLNNLSLTHLALNNKSITTLKAGDFAGLSALPRLDLNDNQLQTLPAEVFAGLTSLTVLWLNDNQLQTLPAGVFDNLTALTRLRLDDNQLQTLPAGVFDNLTALSRLSLNNSQLQTLPAGVFDNLTALSRLSLDNNQFQTLPAGVFTNLTALNQLYLYNNQFQTLPAGVFTGLTSLEALWLQGNPVDPLPLRVDLVRTVMTGQVKATVPAGTPFALTLPIRVTNGTTTVSSTNIATGGTESTAFTITRTDASQPSSVDLSRLPALPTDTFNRERKHRGYHLVKAGLPLQLFAPGVTISSTDLSLIEGSSGSYAVHLNDRPTGQVTITMTTNNTNVTTMPNALTFASNNWNTAQTVTVNARANIATLDDIADRVMVTLTHTVSGYGTVTTADNVVVTVIGMGICDRTRQVRNAIVTAVAGVTDCADITAAHLRRLTGILDLTNDNITTLQAGDFTGLTALTQLRLGDNQLQALPAGVFDSLTALTALILRDNQLQTLPAGLFDHLTALTRLDLYNNQLQALPTGVFDSLTALSTLRLYENQLQALPAGVFDHLTALTRLQLDNNQLQALPAGVFDHLTALTRLELYNNQLQALPAGVFDSLTELTTLSLGGNPLQTLPAGIFDELRELTELTLWSNQLQTLPADMFQNLTQLTLLWLYNNQLRTLPAGIFSGLSELNNLFLRDNAVDPLPLAVSIVPTSVRGQVKATVPIGSPFALTLPITVTNGSAVGSITIARGGTESSVFTITRTDAGQPSSVDFGSLPNLPNGHNGYSLVKSALPLQLFAPGVTVSPTSLNLNEGDLGDYTVRLGDLPTNQVTVTMNSDNRDVTTVPKALTFTTTDWHMPQTVTVNARWDTNGLTDTVAVSHRVSGYGPLESASTVSVIVNEALRPDVNHDGQVDAEDAIILFYVYELGESLARNILLQRQLDSGAVAQVVSRANAWRLSSIRGDVNLDGSVNAQDALIMYYDYEFGDLLQEQAELRRFLLDELRAGLSAEDASYRQLLRSAQALQ